MTTINRTPQDPTKMPEPKDAYFEGHQIIYKNFSGKQTQMNSAGNRVFSILITDLRMAQDLYDQGYNIKDKRLREGEPPEAQQWHLPVKASWAGWSVPRVARVMKDLQTGEETSLLDLSEQTVGVLDSLPILKADILVNASFYDYMGNLGFKTYLKSLYVHTDDHIIDARYSHLPPTGR